MKIAIIGAGAMGSLYGAKLSRDPENEVWLLDVWQDHVDAVNREGLQMETNGEWETYAHLSAATDPQKAGIVDLAIIFVKSTLTRDAIRSNQAILGPETLVLTLQNGLGNVDQIKEVIGEDRIIAGTTGHGATMLGPGKIRHAGSGKTIIGLVQPVPGSDRPVAPLNQVVQIFRNAGLDTEVSENVIGLIWDKLMVNVGINALTGITKLKNGQLLEHPEIEALLEAAVGEAKQVADALGIQLGFDPISHTKEVCRLTCRNKSSMLQDILNHRKTEIEMINGAIVREGGRCGVATPYNQVLTNLVRFLEKAKPTEEV